MCGDHISIDNRRLQ